MPKREPLPRNLPLTLLLNPPLTMVALLLIAVGCADRLSGTSTTTENTIAGIAMLPAGGAAVGAEVVARSSVVLLTKDHVPTPQVLARTVADTAGVFSLKLPPGTTRYYLEIRRIIPVDTSMGPAPVVSWLREFPTIDQKPAALGTVYLEPTSVVHGRLRPQGGEWNTRVWIGIAGTDGYHAILPVADTAGAEFTLADVPAGAGRLSLYVEPMIQIDQVDKPIPTDTVELVGIASGKVREVGTLPFQPR